MSHPRLFEAFLQTPWAIDTAMLGVIGELLQGRGDELAAAAIRERRAEAIDFVGGEPLPGARNAWVRDGVAVLPIMGVISPYANLFTMISGGTTVEQLARDYAVAQSSNQVRAILFQVDSPGGAVTGINEFAARVFADRGGKPVETYVVGSAQSAAYWIATAANRVSMDRTALVGSIGVRIVVRTGSDKGQFEILSSQSPLKNLNPETDAGRQALQRRADDLASLFIDTVATHRGVSADSVAADFGRGDSLIGQAAVDVGMADDLDSFEAVMARLAEAAKPRGVRMSAEESTMTVDTIKANHPAIAAALINEGRADMDDKIKQAETAAFQLGSEAGAETERKRIGEILELSASGYSELIDAAVADGKSTAADVALQILRSDKDRGTSIKDQRSDATSAPGAKPPAPGDQRQSIVASIGSGFKHRAS